MSRIFALTEEDAGLSEEKLEEKYTGEFKIKNVVGKNLLETYEVNGRKYTDNLPKNASISISKEQYIEYEQKKEEIKRLNNIINEFMEELKWQRKVSLSLNEAFAVSRIDTLINCLQELKGSDK